MVAWLALRALLGRARLRDRRGRLDGVGLSLLGGSGGWQRPVAIIHHVVLALVAGVSTTNGSEVRGLRVIVVQCGGG